MTQTYFQTGKSTIVIKSFTTTVSLKLLNELYTIVKEEYGEDLNQDELEEFARVLIEYGEVIVRASSGDDECD